MQKWVISSTEEKLGVMTDVCKDSTQGNKCDVPNIYN